MALLDTEQNGHPLAESHQEGDPFEAPPPYESVVLGQADASSPNPLPSSDQPGPSFLDDGHVRSGVYGSPHNDSFQLKVVDPVKQGDGVGAFISYKVVSSVQAQGYRPGMHEVIRRFRDFTWLRNRIRSQCRGIIVPALPEKNVLEKYKMTAEFVEQRRAALGVFLNRVAAHPVLSLSPDLRLFLQADETEFAIESSRTAAGTGGDAPPAATSGAAVAARKTLSGAAKLIRSIGQSAASLGGGGGGATSTAQGSSTASGAPRHSSLEEESPHYLTAREYFSGLEGHLSEVHHQAERLVKQQSSLASAFEEFGAAMGSLGRHQGGSASGSNAVEALEQLGAQAAAVSAVCRRSSEDISRCFEAPLKEFVRSVRAAKKAMTDRSEALAARRAARAEVDSRRARLSRLRATPGTREERISEAERDLQAAQRAADAAAEAYDALKERMDPDLERFQRDRVDEMEYVLRDFAQAQERSAAEAAQLWRALAVPSPGGGAASNSRAVGAA